MKKAIDTTNLRMSYRGPNKNRLRDRKGKELRAELKNWKDKKILRVVVCTAKDFKLDKKIAEKDMANNEYLVLCGTEDTVNLFGEMFARLAEASKKSLSQDEIIDERLGKRKREEDTKSGEKLGGGKRQRGA